MVQETKDRRRDDDDAEQQFEQSIWMDVAEGEKNFLTRGEMAERLRHVATALDGRDVILTYESGEETSVADAMFDGFKDSLERGENR